MSQLRGQGHLKITKFSSSTFLFYHCITPCALGGSFTKTISATRLKNDRFDRSKRVAWLDFESIERTKVLVVGCGAVGCEVSKNLVLSGFKNITFIDMDRIQISNLNRCIFFTEIDAQNERFKAEVIAERLKLLDENINVNFHNKKIQEMPEEFIPSFDLVFGCLDNIEARLHLNAFCYLNKIPYVDSATNGFSGKVQVVLAPETPCLECNMNRSHMKDIELRRSCTGSDFTFFENPYPAEITTTSVIAAVQVREGLKIVSKEKDIIKNSIFYYNGENNISEEIEIEQNPNCPHHN